MGTNVVFEIVALRSPPTNLEMERRSPFRTRQLSILTSNTHGKFWLKNLTSVP